MSIYFFIYIIDIVRLIFKNTLLLLDSYLKIQYISHYTKGVIIGQSFVLMKQIHLLENREYKVSKLPKLNCGLQALSV